MGYFSLLQTFGSAHAVVTIDPVFHSGVPHYLQLMIQFPKPLLELRVARRHYRENMGKLYTGRERIRTLTVQEGARRRGAAMRKSTVGDC